MGQKTTIGWCHHTFNPWWGCTEAGPECDHCYARTFSHRLGFELWNVEARRFFGAVHWGEPRIWNTMALKAGERRRVFCGSMCDVGERMSTPLGQRLQQERVKLWGLIEQTRGLDWLLLTKRPQNLPAIVPPAWMSHGFPSNVWVGTTAGDLPGWRKRVKYLRRLPAVVRFVSVEPMLGPMAGVELAGVDWVIIGGESGAGARPFELAAAGALLKLCQASGVAAFVKQFGARPVISVEAWRAEADGGRAPLITPRGRTPEVEGAGLVQLALNHPKGEDPGEWAPRFRVQEFPKPRLLEQWQGTGL